MGEGHSWNGCISEYFIYLWGFLFSAKAYYIFFGVYGGSITVCKIVCVAKVGITFPGRALHFL
jgi:hypothetical protein